MKIRELLAKNLSETLSNINSMYDFDIKTIYNQQEPTIPRQKQILTGVMSFTGDEVSPSDLKAYTMPAMVSIYCVKELANEVVATINALIDSERGKVIDLGEIDDESYFALPTYSTPDPSELSMIGQMGESVQVSFFVSYVVYAGLVTTNDISIELDGQSLVFTSFNIAKEKGTNEDNIANNTILESIPQSQAISYSIVAYLSNSHSELVKEIMTKDYLKTKHTLKVNIIGVETEYNVIIKSGNLSGIVGGLVQAQIIFNITG